MIEAVKSYYEQIHQFKTLEEKHIKDTISLIFDELKNNKLDLSKIYLKNDRSLTDLSQKVFGDYNAISTAMFEYAIKQVNPKKQDNPNKKEQDLIDKKSEKAKYFSLEAIKQAFDQANKNRDNDNLLNFQKILDSFAQLSKAFDDIKTKFDSLENIFKKYNQDTRDLLQTNAEEDVKTLKEFLDIVNDLLHSLRIFHITQSEDKANILEKEERFYLGFEECYFEIANIIPLYNKIRNYITQKPYSHEKFKLNFEDSTLANGWDKSKEQENKAILFFKDDKYYLGVMDKKHNKLFTDDIIKENQGQGYKKLVYKMLAGAAKSIPKCSTQLKEIKQYFEEGNQSSYILKNTSFIEPLEVTEEVYELNNYVYDNQSKSFVAKLGNDDKRPKAFQKAYSEYNPKNYKYSLGVWIDFCKDFLAKYKSTSEYDYNFKETKEYKSLDEFYRDIDGQSYKLSFENISDNYINSLIDDGKLYLFQIYNKDFSSYSKGRPNLHTLYWKALFDERNLQDVVYKLNGEAELFYRKKSIPKKITHPAKEAIANKNKNNPKKQSIFEYDLIKDKRFTQDKFFFHCPITMNFKSSGITRFNDEINNLLKQKNDDVHILSIDRGERHLAYYTLLDRAGNIIKQDTFNIIGNDRMKTNYHDKLAEIEKNLISNIISMLVQTLKL